MPAGERSKRVGVFVREKLRHDIIFGRLEPGQKLRLDALQRDFGASVSTLRESINFLSGEGFIEMRGQGGFFVPQLSRDNLRELTEARLLVESHSTELAIKHGTMEWETKLVAAHHKLHRTEQMLSGGDESVRGDWHYFDRAFHQALIVGCGSSEIVKMHELLISKCMRYHIKVGAERCLEAAAEHKALFDAALARDAVRAKTILREHLLRGEQYAAGALD
ncbi:MAG: GntR family transcriptional regulator [Paracoccaceae bacterium]|nr:GntR family transcriptional regulator [Paracoccaceae bacterium]